MMRRGISSLALCLAGALMMMGLGCQPTSSSKPEPSINKPPEQKPNKQPNPDPG
ncbi:MAG TPA: hypothetical protein VMF69_15640 [Gemmataceae bacterium]|nr:hypothetical protein [Gemmataceae bacterium]